jgi:hypothetical protein
MTFIYYVQALEAACAFAHTHDEEILFGTSITVTTITIYIFAAILVTLFSRQDAALSGPQSANYYDSRTLFDMYWKTAARIISTFHAFTVACLATALVMRHGWDVLRVWDLCQINPGLCNTIRGGNAVMAIYLFVDLFFLIYFKPLPEPATLKRRLLERGETDWHWILAIVHHLVGGCSMLAFVIMGRLQYNSLYYMLTEVSTIPLNAAWLLKHHNWHHSGFGRYLFLAAGYTTVFLFFTIRILGSIVQSYWILGQLESIIADGWITSTFAIGGNLILDVLNLVWFSKLVAMALNGGKTKED